MIITMNKEKLNKMLSGVFPTESIYCIYTTEETTIKEIANELSSVPRDTLIVFVGDSSIDTIYKLAEYIKNHYVLKTCWYSGASLRKDFPLKYFDYLKTGPYIKEYGGLDSPTTNQRFYEIKTKEIRNSNMEIIDSYRYLEDITYKFQKKHFNDVRNNQINEG